MQIYPLQALQCLVLHFFLPMGQRSRKDENSSVSLPNSIGQYLEHNQHLYLKTLARLRSYVSEGAIHHLLKGMQMLRPQFYYQ